MANHYYVQNAVMKSISKKLSIVINMPWILFIFILALSSIQALAGGETRTLDLYHVHTGERLTITYMKHGKHIPSAMVKINYLMRDWRRNEMITISARTIDLMWELHADLGSRKPLHVLSAYRSPKTDDVSEKPDCDPSCHSEHAHGDAIDFYFPDVPSIRIRNSALVRQVGGVGYYPSGGGPTGFLHIDSGRVRNWGPAISSAQMAKIMHDYRKTVGARINKKGMKAVPEVELAASDATAAKLPSQQEEAVEGDQQTVNLKAKKKVPLETGYSEDDDAELAGMSEDIELAGMSESVDVAPVKPKARPEDIESNDNTAGSLISKSKGILRLETGESLKPFVEQMRECWIIPPGAREASTTVVLSISFNPDGSVAGQPEIMNPSESYLFVATAQSAITAVLGCQNYVKLPRSLLNGAAALLLKVNASEFTDGSGVDTEFIERQHQESQSRSKKIMTLTEICMQSLNSDQSGWSIENAETEGRKQVDAFGMTVDACRAQLGLVKEDLVSTNVIEPTSTPQSNGTSGRRIALVVGVNDYEYLPPLQKALNDSRAVSQALVNIGYDVVSVENPDRRTLSKKLSELQSKIKPGDNALFYFAGHGVALGGENILLAKDMPKPAFGDEDIVRDEGFSVDDIVRRIQKKEAKTAFLVLDACRDNPFEASGTRSIGGTRGLEKADTPSGVFVLFSAGIGQAALDRLSDSDYDPNSVFTRKLLPVLSTKGITLTGVAKSVQKEVADLAATINHAQQPAYYDQIIGEVVINPE